MISPASKAPSSDYLDASSVRDSGTPPSASLSTLPSQPSHDGEDIKVANLQETILRLSREQNKIQDLLSSLGFALRSFNNLNQFLELTPLMAARVADAEGGALILFKQDGQVTFEHLHCTEEKGCQDVRHALEQITLKLTYHRQEIGEPAIDLQQFSGQSLDEQIQAYLGTNMRVYGTPILVKNNERGKLYIFSRDPEYQWTITRRKLVQLIADQTAVAIANNDLTIELRQKEKLDRELEIASEIQTHLLPSQCPQIKGVVIAAENRSAYRVGGDYYDFIPTNYDRIHSQNDPQAVQCVPWSIVIGDVMGKGVPAGLIMTMTRGMLRAEVLNRHSPAKILEHLNRVMYTDLESSHRFVTLFYSEYDPKTHTLSYSNAAHHPPLLWRQNSNTIEKLDTAGMLVGLDLNSRYEDASVHLSPGDIVLYYTDGFTDAVNAHGDRFDEDNLCYVFKEACQSCKNPDAIVQDLFTQVDRFTAPNTRNGDDMTLVVMQVESESDCPE